MKIITLTIFFMYIPFTLLAQIQKERRVYYLDCSYSMVSNGLWDKVRNNLVDAIDNISDETTEIMVIPFAFNSSERSSLTPISALATTSGKEMLKKRIESLPMNKRTKTYHYIPINDFYNNRVSNDRVTYMFLMTDGQDEDNLHRTKKYLLQQWGKKFGDKNVFGFYVMLNDSAKDSNIENIINNQQHLWKVETADVNINLIRLHNHAVFNARNDKYFDLPIYGNADKIKFDAFFPQNAPYRVKNVSFKGNYLRVNVSCTKNVHSLPISEIYPLTISASGCGKYDFLVTEKVIVKCESKPERSLKISVR